MSSSDVLQIGMFGVGQQVTHASTEPLPSIDAHALAQGGCRSTRDAAESLRPLLAALWSVAVRYGRELGNHKDCRSSPARPN